MNHRVLRLSGALLLTAALAGASGNRPGGGGGYPPPPPPPPPPGSHDGLPEIGAGQKDCGTINAADPVTAAEQQVASCFAGYHAYSGVYVKIENGSSVIVFQATGHSVTLTHATRTNAGGYTVTKTDKCSGQPNSQFALAATGKLTGLFGNTCGL
jgi:hypothetical protein